MTDRHRLTGACLAIAFAIAACTGADDVPSTTSPPASPTTTPTSGDGAAPSPTPAAAASGTAVGPLLDQPWATAELTDVATGDVFRIADHAGKVIIIETMAIWCPTCLLQQGDVDAALAQLDAARVVFVALDVDLHEDAAALADYRAQYDFSGSYAVAGIPVARALAEEFGANILNPPLTPIVIVSTDGTATLTEYGRKSPEDIVTLATAAGA